MALIAPVTKFGINLEGAYHKISRLTYDSSDAKEYVYQEPQEDGAPVPPEEKYVKKAFCYFELSVYASEESRSQHMEPLYKTSFGFTPSLDAESQDIIAQAYAYLKTEPGYAEAIDC